MKAWKIVAIPTLITLLIGGIYLFAVFKHRQNPGVVGQTDENASLTSDDLAVVRAYFPQHFEDTQRLEGTSVWMKNGYTIPYFPYRAGKVDFKSRVGLLPAMQRLEIKKIIKSAVPESVDDSMSHGTRQALAVFTLPGGTDQFAMPIGAIEGSEEQYFCDLLLYYDDPHTIYNHWPKDVWAAIDAHQVKPGMSELETRLSVGQKMHPDGDSEGNRTVTYDQDGRTWTVTYVKDKATAVKAG
ncbi:MAG TPA: hypothetical protein VK716_03975 [Terracidiphilus sp.]|nr:hypothetical protein [Terracidiphilus sp.]